MSSVFEDVSRTLLLGLTRPFNKGLSVIHAERAIFGLTFEQMGEGRRIIDAYRSIGTQVNTLPPRRSMG